MIAVFFLYLSNCVILSKADLISKLSFTLYQRRCGTSADGGKTFPSYTADLAWRDHISYWSRNAWSDTLQKRRLTRDSKGQRKQIYNHISTCWGVHLYGSFVTCINFPWKVFFKWLLSCGLWCQTPQEQGAVQIVFSQSFFILLSGEGWGQEWCCVLTWDPPFQDSSVQDQNIRTVLRVKVVYLKDEWLTWY